MTDQTTELPRGIRNKNPGNVRANPHIMWRGQAGVDDDGFLIFDSFIHGIRCMAMILRHYHEYNNCNSLDEYIARYSPSTENDTYDYIQAVAKCMGVDHGTMIDLHTQGAELVKCIIIHENGYNPCTLVELEQGVHLSHIQ